MDRCLALRDRLLASPRFQHWACGFPLTRRTARRHAAELFDLCAGFVYSQILFACVRLRLFEALSEGPCSPAVLAPALGVPEARLVRLLDAAATLRLVEPRGGGRYGLGPLGAALLGQPAVATMIEHHGMLYDDLRDPVALLRDLDRDTALSRYWAYARAEAPQALSEERLVAYSQLMSATSALVADQALDAHDFTQHHWMLDVGGGEGNFALAAAARAPRLRVTVFDLPPVAARAHARFAAAGLGDRVQAVGGSFLCDPLPAGADLVTLVRILHDHDDDAVARLLRAVHDALPSHGALLVVEPTAGTPGAERMGAAYFGLYFLAMRRGSPRSTERLGRLLHAAGFSDVSSLRTRNPLQASVLLARP